MDAAAVLFISFILNSNKNILDIIAIHVGNPFVSSFFGIHIFKNTQSNLITQFTMHFSSRNNIFPFFESPYSFLYHIFMELYINVTLI